MTHTNGKCTSLGSAHMTRLSIDAAAGADGVLTALRQAQPGDEVVLRAGVFALTEPLVLNSGVAPATGAPTRHPPHNVMIRALAPA